MTDHVLSTAATPRPLLTVLTAHSRRMWLQNLLLFSVCFTLLLLTMVPSIYTLDSAEFVIGSATLGFVHAPGYPLYLMVAHLFTLLPIGDVFFRVTLFTSLCLAATACVLYSLLLELLGNALVALGAVLTFIWSYYVWMSGLFPEIYAPQLLTLALCTWLLTRIYRRQQRDLKTISVLGVLVGIAVATAPQSAFLGLGLVVGLCLMRIPWRTCVFAAGISIALFLLSLLYFPLRFQANPVFNALGIYDAAGMFHSPPLNTLDSIVQILRGTEFKRLFFAEGYLPAVDQLAATFGWFWDNFLGIGLIAAVIGLGVMAVRHRGIFATWLVAFLPYTYFYTTYGASDRETMFGPAYLLLAIAIAYGLAWLTQNVKKYRALYVLVLPLFLLVINFPLLNLNRETQVRTTAEMLMSDLPQNADVLGDLYEIFPLQYLQIIEGWRSDVHLYPTFMFKGTLVAFVNSHYNALKPMSHRPVVLLEGAAESGYLSSGGYRFSSLAVNAKIAALDQPIRGGYRVTPIYSWTAQ
ncbi:MAG: DUF2723 domain-containing protein [Chloroflexota bacterium]